MGITTPALSFVVRHISGKQMIADTLSRLVKDQRGKLTNRNLAEEYVRYVAESATPHTIPVPEVEHESGTDPELCILRDCIQGRNWYNCPATYKCVRNELCMLGKLILRGTRISVPHKFKKMPWPGIDCDTERVPWVSAC